jgi:hypothetical protein
MKNKKGTINIVWSDIDSSLISDLDYYHDGNKGMLQVTFASYDSYIYNDVGIDEIIKLLKADSVGSEFSKSIRMSYPYKSIGKNEKQ